MPGAYVAKPAVVSVPDVPPGWNPSWPRPGDPGYDPDPFFPAPFPPGHETDYSIVTTATASISPTGTASATSSVREYDDYATNEPSAITWTATIDGEPVNLKFDGGSFASSIEEDPVWGTYWGTTPDIIFNLNDSNDEDTVVLKASCTLVNSEGQEQVLEDTSDVTISATQVYSATLTVTWPEPTNRTNYVGSYPKSFWNILTYIQTTGDSNLAYYWQIYKKTSNGASPTFAWVPSTQQGTYITVTGGDTTLTIQMNDLLLVNSGSNFQIKVTTKNFNGLCDNTATASLKIYLDGVLQTTTNLSLEVTKTPYVVTDNHSPWITINAVTGAVTLVNP